VRINRLNTRFTEEQISAEQQRFIVKVYAWMALALVVTGITAMTVASSPEATKLVLGSKAGFMILLLAEFLMVAALVGWVMKMSSSTATAIFLGYAILNGLTISVIFLLFTAESIASTFFITAGTFAIMSAFGYFTKTDLTGLGNMLIMALIGLIIASVINLYYQNETLDWITTYAGILIFVGLIAYDTQKIKKINVIGNEGTEADKKEAIIGALSLYLDFINLFLRLLRLLGKRK
jgi:uncharacterized protein